MDRRIPGIAFDVLVLSAISLVQSPNAQGQAGNRVWEGTNNKSPVLKKCPRPNTIQYTVTINDRDNRATVEWLALGSRLANKPSRASGTMNEAPNGQKIAVVKLPGGMVDFTITRTSPEVITLAHRNDQCLHYSDMKLKG